MKPRLPQQRRASRKYPQSLMRSTVNLSATGVKSVRYWLFTLTQTYVVVPFTTSGAGSDGEQMLVTLVCTACTPELSIIDAADAQASSSHTRRDRANLRCVESMPALDAERLVLHWKHPPARSFGFSRPFLAPQISIAAKPPSAVQIRQSCSRRRQHGESRLGLLPPGTCAAGQVHFGDPALDHVPSDLYPSRGRYGARVTGGKLRCLADQA
jgi:hypothetical protein